MALEEGRRVASGGGKVIVSEEGRGIISEGIVSEGGKVIASEEGRGIVWEGGKGIIDRGTLRTLLNYRENFSFAVSGIAVYFTTSLSGDC